MASVQFKTNCSVAVRLREERARGNLQSKPIANDLYLRGHHCFGLESSMGVPPKVILTAYIGFNWSTQCLRLEAPLWFCCFFCLRHSFGLSQQIRRSRALL